ncbi:MAG: DUF3299 domain-containing protein [Pirellula sp.]|jgi:hypothetical protein|nr:DUF3299 domain-containing protein [Pirellula sp.]
MRKSTFEIWSSGISPWIRFSLPFWLVLTLMATIALPPQQSRVAANQDPLKLSDSDKASDTEGEKQASDKKEKPPVEDDDKKPSTGTNRGQPAESADPAEAAKERKAREAAKKRGEITFDDLKFEIEKGAPFKSELLTDENKDLDKKTWKIRGFILPTTLFSKSNIKEFVLVRDNQECCFGPGAALYDCIMVTMAPGKSINFSTRVVAVKGVLEIDTESFRYPDSEEHYAIYKMTAEEVK